MIKFSLADAAPYLLIAIYTTRNNECPILHETIMAMLTWEFQTKLITKNIQLKRTFIKYRFYYIDERFIMLISSVFLEDPELLYSGSIKSWNTSTLQVSKSFFKKMVLNSSLFCFIKSSIPYVSRPLTNCCKGAVSGAARSLK